MKEESEKVGLKLNINKTVHGIWSHHFMAYRRGNSGSSDRFYFLGLLNLCRWWLGHEIKRYLLLGRKALTNLDRVLKSKDIILLTKVCLVKAMVFPIVMYVWMWELDHKEGWVLENWYFWTVMLEKTLESSLNCKIKGINPKENQSWIFIGRTDAEAEAPLLWPPDAKSQLSGKNPDAGKDWRQEEKGATEDEMVGWHRQLNGHESEQTRRQWRTGKPGMLLDTTYSWATVGLPPLSQSSFLDLWSPWRRVKHRGLGEV